VCVCGMRVLALAVVAAALWTCGSSLLFEEEEAERNLIAETTLPLSPMFLGLPVRQVVAGGYFTAALLL
jgi:hypothetical protein